MAVLDERQAAEIEALTKSHAELVALLRRVVARAEALLTELASAKDEARRAEVRHALRGLLVTYGGGPVVEDAPKDPHVLRKRLRAFVAAWERRCRASLR